MTITEHSRTTWTRSSAPQPVFLEALGLRAPSLLPKPLHVAYHDACHLAHAQQVRTPPRRLLVSIPNVTLIELTEGELCCGSAGTYNVEQPALARQLGERKARHVAATGADAVATGNIGCIAQSRSHLAAVGHPIPVYHTMEVLDRAYRSGP